MWLGAPFRIETFDVESRDGLEFHIAEVSFCLMEDCRRVSRLVKRGLPEKRQPRHHLRSRPVPVSGGTRPRGACTGQAVGSASDDHAYDVTTVTGQGTTVVALVHAAGRQQCHRFIRNTDSRDSDSVTTFPVAAAHRDG
jgi:hypothetical protein